MFDINRLIYESVKKCLLNEGLSSILYHFTSIDNGYSICNEDAIYLQSAYAKESDNYDKKRKFYLSCTRLFNSSFGYASKFSSGGVRIKLDGDKLAQRFKGKAINYWKGLNDKYYYYQHLPKNHEEFKKSISWDLDRFKKGHPDATEKDIEHFINHNFNTDAQKHIDNETEDRILSYEPVIRDAHEYILSIDVLLPNLKDDEKQQKIAYSFLYKTKLGSLVKIYDNVNDFNNLKGKYYDSRHYDELLKGKYFDDAYSARSNSTPKEALKYVILFIAYANHDFDKKNFGRMVSNLLQKYDLSHFSNEIGKIVGTTKTWYYDLTNIAEALNNLRRELSDRPNKDNSNILRMLTDYLLSIGANSFREGYQIKKNLAEEYYGYGKVYDRIDTNFKKEFLVIDDRIIIVDPTKEFFCDLVKYGFNWDDDTMKYEADNLSYEIANEYSEEYTYNKEKTKNVNSMFQYIYKLFRKGTIEQVLQTFDKLRATNLLYERIGMNIEYKQMDYWDAIRYYTLNALKYQQSNENYDYIKKRNIIEKDFEKVFPKKTQQ